MTLEKLTCSGCVYMTEQFRCVIDPPHILGIDTDGKTIQADPRVSDNRPACKWHMTETQRKTADLIRMA